MSPFPGRSDQSPAPWLARGAIAAAFILISSAAMAQSFRLEIRPVSQGKLLQLNEPLHDDAMPLITRLDFLLSGLALRRKNGDWIESKDWFASLRTDTGRLTAEGTGTPAGDYSGIRFHIGVPEAVNKADPHLFPADHALNPLVNGLHWGWQGGYIFLALEGRWRRANQDGGFSFHIANAPQLMTVELPVEFRGGGPLTLTLDLNVQRVLKDIDFAQDGASTHSREGDVLAAKLKANIEQAFQVSGVAYDVYQTLSQTGTSNSTSPPPGTHPLAPSITRRFPKVTLPPDNPLTEEGVALGRLLFHDKRLSNNNAQSCASCHDQAHAFADTRRFSQGAQSQIGSRNAMPLFNLAWHSSFFWDGRAPSLREQVLMPIQDKNEMNETLEGVVAKLGADRECVQSFAAAFGSPEITSERMALALEQFLLTLISQESRFDRAARKEANLTEAEKRGLQLFVTEFDPKHNLRGADCFHCHGGTLFTSQPFANNGLVLDSSDIGRMAVTRDEADKGKFKVPSLRNVALTAPYMHDGRFATLEDVVEHYSSGVHRSPTLDPNLAKHPATGIQLTGQEKADLIAFLRTLTDETFAVPGRQTVSK